MKPPTKASLPAALTDAFDRASPPLRRWGGKFANPRLLPRVKKSTQPHFGHAKPHGQEA
ncbi:MAG: hypothetical protein AAF907_08185 [Planctomycetota bacterium]